MAYGFTIVGVGKERGKGLESDIGGTPSGSELPVRLHLRKMVCAATDCAKKRPLN